MRYLLIPIRADISNFFQFLKNMSVYREGERKGGREREYDVWVCVPCHVGRGQDTTSRFLRVSYSLCNGFQGSNLVVRLALQKNLATELSLWPQLQLLMQNNMSR